MEDSGAGAGCFQSMALRKLLGPNSTPSCEVLLFLSVFFFFAASGGSRQTWVPSGAAGRALQHYSTTMHEKNKQTTNLITAQHGEAAENDAHKGGGKMAQRICGDDCIRRLPVDPPLVAAHLIVHAVGLHSWKNVYSKARKHKNTMDMKRCGTQGSISGAAVLNKIWGRALKSEPPLSPPPICLWR